MYIILKEGRLKNIVSLALRKAGNIRKLEKEIEIPRSTLSGYHTENRKINQENFDKFIIYLNMTIDKKDILKILPDNWRQVKGGKKSVETKKKNGTFEKQLRQCHEGSSSYMRLLHKKMKKENPERYHLIQYDKFKKIGGYKCKTERGDFVRNKLEQEVANLLIKIGVNYLYEPIIKINNKYFFPDFLVNDNIILECTEWRGFDKAIKLKNKIKYLIKRYKVYVVIPKTLNRYYETLNKYLILGADNLIQKLNLMSL